uniref:Uncharacterized protein n=1 Tax=Neisseria meningitidis alpha153 TaxID=663926 RepID=C6SEX4_NEIME|nr:hypothetical protein predicted by Glimmer/Critica [Neisseria meningitidis alpha153]
MQIRILISVVGTASNHMEKSVDKYYLTGSFQT